MSPTTKQDWGDHATCSICDSWIRSCHVRAGDTRRGLRRRGVSGASDQVLRPSLIAAAPQGDPQPVNINMRMYETAEHETTAKNKK